MNTINRLLILVLICVGFLAAAKGPQHKTLRALTMGNAFVAVAEDKDAVYYNPAGLWLMNRLGNYKRMPELGYYPRNAFDMRLNLGATLPLGEAADIYDIATDFQSIISRGMESKNGQTGVLDTLAAEKDIIHRLYRYDSKPIFVGTKVDAEMAFHSFGGAIWVDGGVAPFIDGGVITPSAGIDTAYVDAVVQGGIGFSPVPKWMAGIGVKSAKRVYFPKQEFAIMDFTNEGIMDSIEADRDTTLNDVFEFDDVGVALELGAMYQWKREMRFGASLRDLFVKQFDNQKVTPDLTVGMVYSPRKLQRNTAFYRKVNLAADFADALNNDKNYKFFSHINMGVEVEQVFLAIPSLRFSGLRAIKGRGALGFKGGYFTLGGGIELLRILNLDFATWADEGGSFTGQREDRYYLLQVSVGL